MARALAIIHGWSDTWVSFQDLAKLIRKDLELSPVPLDLANYVSMDDAVTFDDIVAAMDRAWNDAGLSRKPWEVDVLVHSTGGLVVRDWLTRNFAPDESPIKRLLMLAPANFGSPLAHKGYSFIGRIVKGWSSEKMFQTGELVLKGLEMASPYSWDLAARDRFGKNVWYAKDRILCTVLVGNTGYTGIAAAANVVGGDGTVLVSTANMNAAFLGADFSVDPLHPAYSYQPSNGQAAFAVMDGENHGTIVAKNGGIRNPMTKDNIKSALTVTDDGFLAWCSACQNQTDATMEGGAARDYTHGYQNTVSLVRDQFGKLVSDYFMEFYAENDDKDDVAGFFHGEAMQTGHAFSDNKAYRSLLVDCTRLVSFRASVPNLTLRVSLTAHPEFRQNGHVGYPTFADTDIGAIALDPKMLDMVFQPNRTLLTALTIQRRQTPDVFTFHPV
jgi:hypothetical protein